MLKKLELDYRWWRNNANVAFGQTEAYTDVNLQKWSPLAAKMTLKDCEAKINDLRGIEVNDQDAEDLMFRIFDLIQMWGGKMGRSFYISVDGKPSRRELLENDSAAYVEAVVLAEKGKSEAIDAFQKVEGLGPSFASKHAYFWSEGKLPILDNKLAGVFGFKTPNDLLKEHSYDEFRKHLEELASENEVDIKIIERGLFAFHKNYFLNDNSAFVDSDFKDGYTDFHSANDVAESLGIPKVTFEEPLELNFEELYWDNPEEETAVAETYNVEVVEAIRIEAGVYDVVLEGEIEDLEKYYYGHLFEGHPRSRTIFDWLYYAKPNFNKNNKQ